VIRFRHIAVFLLIAAAGAGNVVVAAEQASITIPMTTAADVKKRIAGSLEMRVFGDEGGFQVEVTSQRHVRGCFHNLAHWAPHGPDLSDVMPWHTSAKWYPNIRVVSVCGHPLELVISIVSPQVAGEGNKEKFVAGTLAVTVRRQGKRN
jgi:hypothetical protein